ncbi:MAG TPA: type II secretion system protein [Candidatus Pristimantibacillus sp.]|nr:type II secretion system protein [Candidatus Pristimantibacillus sp.]
MLSKLRQSKKEQGFTIIEVLIVLAIAGLILLVVFLAVPALQRNARNTQRTEDAGNILSAITEFATNNNGSLPAAGGTGGSGSSLTVGGSGTNTVPVNLGYYDAANVSIVAWSTGLTNTSTTDKAIIVKGAVCSTTTTGDPASGSTRAVVILYTLETSSKQCRAS